MSTDAAPSWACYMCTYENEQKHAKCAICETPKLNGNNNINRSKSPAKGRDRSRSRNRHSPVPSTSTWACQSCTFVNNSSLTECSMCGRARTNDARKSRSPKRLCSASSIGAWTCKSCGTENCGSALRCESCSHRHTTTSRNETSANNSSQHDAITSVQSTDSDRLRKEDERQSTAMFQTLTKYCNENKEKFIDDSFPPCDRSIGDLSTADDARERARAGINAWRFVWLRPEQIFTLDGQSYRWAMFRDPKPNDIQQGALGNCWLVSSLAVLAERPDLLDHIVITKQYNHNGIYQIRLCVNGLWQTVIVDDLLPCRADSRSLAFSQARNNQLWVPLIEKALAKVCGSYASLVAGRSHEGLAVLTGAPCYSVPLEPQANVRLQDLDASGGGGGGGDEAYTMDMVWAKLLSSHEAGFLMSCSCAAGQRSHTDAECESVGLLAKHAYSLLDVLNVNGIKLVRLRNPWGQFSWRGAYSTGSPLWTDEMKKAVAALARTSSTDNVGGTFWMPFEDFCVYFDTVDVCQLRTHWHELRIVDKLPPYCRQRQHSVGNGVHLLRVKHTTELDLAMYQDNYRSSKPRPGAHGELDMCLLLLRVGFQPGTVGDLITCSSRSIAPFVCTSALVHAGDYLIVPCAFNHFGSATTTTTTNNNNNDAQQQQQLRAVPSCVIAVHSARPVMLQPMLPAATMMADALIQLVIAKAKRQILPDIGVTSYYLSSGFCGLLVVVENMSDESSVQCLCDCSESVNVVSTRGTLRSADVIPPLHRQILVLLTQLEKSASYFVRHSLSHRRSGYRGDRLGDFALDPSNRSAQHEPTLTEPIAGLHSPRPMFIV